MLMSRGGEKLDGCLELGAWTVEAWTTQGREKVGSRQQLEAQDDITQWQRAGLGGGYIKPVTWQRCG